MENAHRASRMPAAAIPKRVLAMLAAGFVVLALLIAVVQLYWARHHLLSGAGQLNAAISVVKSPAALESPSARDHAISNLRLARNNFASARGDLDVWAPALSGLGWVPRYGEQLRAAPPAAASAYFATSSALEIVRGAEPLLSRLGPGGSPHLRTLASALVGGVPAFSRAESLAADGVSSLLSVPNAVGSASLQTDIDKLRRDLPRLRGAAAWLAVMPDMLGDHIRRRYLFCWENSAEIRPTGGFIGAVDLVSLRNGRLTKRFTGSAIERRFPVVKLPVPEAVTTLETTWIFRDSNVSPNFPLTARLERWFYRRDTGTSVSTVVDFVDQGIPDLLSATGPIYLKQYRVTVTAANALALADHFASAAPVHFRGPIRPGKVSLDTYRKQFLGFEFAAILHRLQTLPPSRWGLLGQAMVRAIDRKDILIWSKDSRVESAADLSGAGGELRPIPGDFLDVVDDNRSYNKIGPYLRESASYRADLVPGGWLDSTLTLRYHLDRSPPSMEGFGPGLGSLGNKHEFRDFLRVFVPSGSLVNPVGGLYQVGPLGFAGRSLEGQTAYGLTQIAGWFTIGPRQTKIIRINYSVPPNDVFSGGTDAYRLTVMREPGTRLLGVSIHLNSVGSAQFARGNSWLKSYSAWLPLTGDRSLKVPVRSVGDLQTVPLPRAQFGDPLIPTQDLPGL